ncbi:50S ribosomal protein L17 [Candidatus Nanoperiomorbus periodonticus]|uniref:50S ribosomal protein L17 n=1 Tax=Candidatus Nanoperiomorbus periodonticus TaxID=2171989 RepID=UPI00101CC914|nr:50S ribosomal protein L17 [Candidatus Nanoperiomorbus periodonticus]RYC74904.1 50S ribosomal protein L17 [Candidatus Nanoperiomorbus periodonticus]
MHRHGYRGRKFGRERDQRRALMRGLMISLVEHGTITTTLPKAKELRPQAEKMITVARQGSLAGRRRLIAKLNVDTANRLVDVIVPSLKRDSGYLRVTRLDQRRVGDNAELATIEFVDEIAEVTKPDKPTRKKPAKSAQSAGNSKKEDK